jgi:hypothetical protein
MKISVSYFELFLVLFSVRKMPTDISVIRIEIEVAIIAKAALHSSKGLNHTLRAIKSEQKTTLILNPF